MGRGMGMGVNGEEEDPPQIPEKLISDLRKELEGKEAPFLEFLDVNLSLEWLDGDEDRLGATRFECDHNEIYRRRRLGISPGPVTIGINPILREDHLLYSHTLAHELLHASGLLDHDSMHSKIVKNIAPAPKMRDSPLLMRLRNRVLEKLPEEQWICGGCGYEWERVRVTRPIRCPKCAKRFKA